MGVYYVQEVAPQWSVALVQESDAWRIDAALVRQGKERSRLIPSQRIGGGRYESMSSAMDAAIAWLQDEVLL